MRHNLRRSHRSSIFLRYPANASSAGPVASVAKILADADAAAWPYCSGGSTESHGQHIVGLDAPLLGSSVIVSGNIFKVVAGQNGNM